MEPCTISVFLNYAKEDQTAVIQLYQVLKKYPWIDPWLDEEKLLPGQDWEYEIRKAVSSADAFITCTSKKSIKKIGVVQSELREAEKRQAKHPFGDAFIIPIILDDCEVPPSISRYQYVKIGAPGGLDKVIKSLELIRKAKCDS